MKRFFRNENNSGPFFSMFETGLDGVRFDMIRINPYTQYIRIFEFKSCRQDFKSDKKWEKYLKYCHTFTFVCPREVITKDDLINKPVGLLWLYKWKHKGSDRILKDWFIDTEWIKRPKKTEVDTKIITRIAFMLVHRTIWRKDDVF